MTTSDARALVRACEVVGSTATGAMVMTIVQYGFFACGAFSTGLTARDEFKASGDNGLVDGLSGMF